MSRNAAVTILLMVLTLLVSVIDYEYPHQYGEKAFHSLLVITILHIVFKTLLERAAVRKTKTARTRYALRKTINILYTIFLCLVIARLWVEDTQTFALTTALLAAGIAITLQDVFKNFVGGLIILLAGTYRIGDRVEMNAKYGDVIDIGIFYTTVLELKEWVDSEQPTGRLSMIPNGYVLSGIVNNYTKDNNFIWDEIFLPITYDSDWKLAFTMIMDIVKEETVSMSKSADAEILQLAEKYYLDSRSVDPEIFLKLTDNWIGFSIRYVTDVRKRRHVQNTLSKRILESIQLSEHIKIASTTLDITAIPELRIQSAKN